MILDTSVVLEMVINGKVISDNITAVTPTEYPPITVYHNFRGNVYFISEEDQILAYNLQTKLRKIGFPMSVGDLLISAICININETLLTKDEDFLKLKDIEPRFKLVFKK